jgi:hypothetical protein
MIVEIFIPKANPVYPLLQQAKVIVTNLLRSPLVGETIGNSRGQLQTPVHLSKKNRAAVTGYVPTSEFCLNKAPFTACEINAVYGTFCHGEILLFIHLKQLNYKGYIGFRLLFL